MSVYEERYQKVIKILEEKELDSLIVSNACNMRYLSGFSGDSGYLYLSKNKKVVLTDSRYTIQAEEEAEDYQVLEVAKAYGEEIKALLEREQGRRVGFESKDMFYYDISSWKKVMEKIEWIPLEEELSHLRIVKTVEEIKAIETAESIGDKAFSDILNIIKPGMTELEIAANLEFSMKKYGGENLSFDTIVASGLHSSMPHAVPTNKKIENGDFITMDFGCIYEGYCSDMTRTIVVGKVSDEQKKVYQTVLNAQMAAIDFIKAGYQGKEIDSVARTIIEEAGYKGCFGHGLGHSVGLFIHESPRLSPKEETVIVANVTETVEPGIYIKGFGGVRIEDLVVVTEEGCRNLTHSEKRLIVL